MTLVDRLGTGFYDFFHEPALGFVAGPEQFGKGLAKGTQSLIKNTLSGLFGSASKFTDAVSGGLVKVFLFCFFLFDFLKKKRKLHSIFE